jgi:hypothetical protein
VQRRATADPAHRHDRARPRDLVDVDDVVAAADAEIARLPRALGERLQDRPRQPHEIQTAHRGAREPDEPEPDPIALRDRVTLEQAAFGEDRRQP